MRFAMKKTLSIIAILAVAATACNKVDITPDNGEPAPTGKMITEIITGGQDATTKVTIDADAKFAWTVGDNVAVHVSNGESHQYVFTSGEGGASAAAATASFTVSYPDGYSRDAFAVYPSTIVSASAANYGQSGATLDVTLPASYTLDEVQGEKFPCPMIATNTGSNWEFKQLCGLLRLTVKQIPADALGLIIQFPGRKVNGAFSIATPVTPESSVIPTAAPATGEDKIVVTFAAGTTEATINIPLPTGDYDDVFITPVGSATKVAAVRHIKAGGYTATRARGKKLTTTMVAFSVSASKKVVFAPGNLWATFEKTSSTWTWSFAPPQYDIIGYGPGNTLVNAHFSLSNNGTVDLFSFSNNAHYGIKYSQNDTDFTGTDADFWDWGKNSIGGYIPNYWHTLSKDEWKYVTGRDTFRDTGGTVAGKNNALCTRAIVNGVKGFIIFPDLFSGLTPTGVNWVTGSIQDGHYDNTLKGWEDDKVATITTVDAWDALEAEGCVFLPVAGTRLMYVLLYIDGGYGGVTNPTGFYASKNVAPNNSDGVLQDYCLRFNDDGYDPQNYNLRKYGNSVRLVHEL